MSSVPILHENILLKFDLVQTMLETIPYDLELYDDLIQKKLSYISDTSNDLHNYFNSKSKTATEQYTRHLMASGVLQGLDTIVSKLSVYSNEKLIVLVKQYKDIPLDIRCNDPQTTVCVKCDPRSNSIMEIDEVTSELVCHNCGTIQKLYGEVFADEQFYYQEGQRNKHGKYDPTKHCKFWIERIQAKENVSIPDEVINQIKRCMRRDNMYVDTLTCETIRGYLKQLKLTTYNNNVPLIRKLITRKEIPEFTERELKLIYKYFSIVIDVFSKIKSEDKSNCPYHPYFIYKIVEQIIYKPEDINRKKEILSSIHLQSRETINDNDKTWFEICEYIKEFQPMPTIR